MKGLRMTVEGGRYEAQTRDGKGTPTTLLTRYAEELRRVVGLRRGLMILAKFGMRKTERRCVGRISFWISSEAVVGKRQSSRLPTR